MTDSEQHVQRINGELHKVTPVLDQDGKVVTHHVQRLHLELSSKDRVQILVGATILAIPTAFTEEVWNLGDDLSWISVISLAIVSLVFIGLFIYLNSYQQHMKLYGKPVLESHDLDLPVLAGRGGGTVDGGGQGAVGHRLSRSPSSAPSSERCRRP